MTQKRCFNCAYRRLLNSELIQQELNTRIVSSKVEKDYRLSYSTGMIKCGYDNGIFHDLRDWCNHWVEQTETNTLPSYPENMDEMESSGIMRGIRLNAPKLKKT